MTRRSRIGTAIRTARRAAGMTQEELSGTTSISASFISKVERGESIPGSQTLAALAEALALDLSRVLNSTAHDHGLSIRRLELEERASHAVRELDDRMLMALIEFVDALKRTEGDTNRHATSQCTAARQHHSKRRDTFDG